jgi:glucosamine--fructose-6-phosphate aminotransferase (isomerizing)
MRAGPEIGVAATKTFTSSLVSLYLLALYIGLRRGFIRRGEAARHIGALLSLPGLLGRLLEDEEPTQGLAYRFYGCGNFLYIARGINYPVALEGALKLKEISYIHAEGCAAGELKHGPLALVDGKTPVVVIAPKDRLRPKVLGDIQEVKARDGVVIAIATEGDRELAGRVDHTLYIPEAPPLLNPLLAVVPLQLLAYRIALLRGCDVDQPRNLAKSVTVE